MILAVKVVYSDYILCLLKNYFMIIYVYCVFFMKAQICSSTQ